MLQQLESSQSAEDKACLILSYLFCTPLDDMTAEQQNLCTRTLLQTFSHTHKSDATMDRRVAQHRLIQLDVVKRACKTGTTAMIALFVWQRLLILLGATITWKDMYAYANYALSAAHGSSIRPRPIQLALQRPAHACITPPGINAGRAAHFRVRRSSRCTAGQSSIHCGTSPT